MNLNRVFLIGRLTRDPESRAMPSGQTVSNFGLATNRVWTNPETNEKQEQTEFHNIVAFGKLADICNQYLSKGSLVFIEGRIQTRNWQNQNGETKYRTEIIAERLQMGPKAAQPSKEAPAEEGIDTAEDKGIKEIQVDESEEEKPKEKKKLNKRKSTEASSKGEDNLGESKDEVKSEDIPF